MEKISRFCIGALICYILFEIVTTFYVNLFCLAVSWITFNYLEERNKRLHPVKSKAVLITGCDTGFGHHLAVRLAKNGFYVFASVLHGNGSGAGLLRDEKVSNLHVIEIDVTNKAHIRNAISIVDNAGTGLWGIVNNAGFEIPGDIELVTLEQYKKVMDTNLWGQIAIIKAFLPMIRKSKGRIVNISSVRGRYAWPSGSTYHISKYGVETMSDSLRLEMEKFGVGVSIVEPGWFDEATSIKSSEMCSRVKMECDVMWAEGSDEVKTYYGEQYFYIPHELYLSSTTSPSASSPKPVLDAIEDALLNFNPKPRYLIFGGKRYYDPYSIFATLYNLTPQFISDFVISRFSGSHRKSI